MKLLNIPEIKKHIERILKTSTNFEAFHTSVMSSTVLKQLAPVHILKAFVNKYSPYVD